MKTNSVDAAWQQAVCVEVVLRAVTLVEGKRKAEDGTK
jgi:hypothetical protein